MRIHVFLLGVLALAAAGHDAGAEPSRKVSIAMEASANAVAGGHGAKCKAGQVADMGKPGEWWIAAGDARPNPQGGWEAAGASIRCGVGAPPPPQEASGASATDPYLIATVSTAAGVLASRLGADNVLRVSMSVSIRKLAGFTATQAPRYQQSEATRVF